MDGFDAANLGITVGLGILSVGIAVFAIALSMKFQSKSDAALDSIKELSHHIQQNVEVSLTHQKDFSAKLLDSLIEKNQYGAPELDQSSTTERIEDVVQNRLNDIENGLFERIESKITSLNTGEGSKTERLEDVIKTLRSEIHELKDTAQQASSEAILPVIVKDRLESFVDFPAHFVVLAGIIKSNARTYDDLKKAQQKYHFPDNFDSGLENLMQADLVIGSHDEFEVNPEFKPYIEDWVRNNWRTLNRLMKNYSTKEEEQITDTELAIANRLRFDLKTINAT